MHRPTATQLDIVRIGDDSVNFRADEADGASLMRRGRFIVAENRLFADEGVDPVSSSG